MTRRPREEYGSDFRSSRTPARSLRVLRDWTSLDADASACHVRECCVMSDRKVAVVGWPQPTSAAPAPTPQPAHAASASLSATCPRRQRPSRRHRTPPPLPFRPVAQLHDGVPRLARQVTAIIGRYLRPMTYQPRPGSHHLVGLDSQCGDVSIESESGPYLRRLEPRRREPRLPRRPNP